ncbi:MAG: glycosyl hydrolase family 28-related protein [Thermomicrobiales bacterium]
MKTRAAVYFSGVVAALCAWIFSPAQAEAACVVNVGNHGAVPDDAISDSAAIAAAIGVAQNAGGGEVCFAAGRYRLSNPIQWTVGSAFKPVTLVGLPGATVLSPDGPGFGAIAVGGVASGAAGVNAGRFGVRGITVSPYPGVTPSTNIAGITLGQPGQFVDGTLESLVSNIRVERYPVGLRVRNIRQVAFDRIVIDQGTTWGVEIHPNEALPNGFTSDLTFTNLDAKMTYAASSGLLIWGEAAGPGTASQIRTIRVSHATISGGQNGVVMSARGSRISDVELDDLSFTTDKPSADGIHVGLDPAGGFISGLHIKNAYLTSKNLLFKGIHFDIPGAGSIENVRVVGGTINRAETAVDLIGRVRGLSLSNMRFSSIKPAFAAPGPWPTALWLRGSATRGYPQGITIRGNTMVPGELDTFPPFMVGLFSGVCAVSVMGNVSPAVTDFTGSTYVQGPCPGWQGAWDAGF